MQPGPEKIQLYGWWILAQIFLEPFVYFTLYILFILVDWKALWYMTVDNDKLPAHAQTLRGKVAYIVDEALARSIRIDQKDAQNSQLLRDRLREFFSSTISSPSDVRVKVDKRMLNGCQILGDTVKENVSFKKNRSSPASKKRKPTIKEHSVLNKYRFSRSDDSLPLGPDDVYATRATIRSLRLLALPLHYHEAFQRGILKQHANTSAALLYGPRGVGKSMLVKAMAREVGGFVWTITDHINWSNFNPRCLEQLRTDLRDMFERIQLQPDMPPCVFLWHSIDKILSVTPGSDADSDTALAKVGLFEIFKETALKVHGGTSPVRRCIVVATSSNPHKITKPVLDLLKRKIYVPLPDEEARLQILKIQFAGEYKGASLFFEGAPWIIKRTKGFSGADLHELAYHAAMGAALDTSLNLPREIRTSCRVIIGLNLEEGLRWVRPSVSAQEVEEIEKFHVEQQGIYYHVLSPACTMRMRADKKNSGPRRDISVQPKSTAASMSSSDGSGGVLTPRYDSDSDFMSDNGCQPSLG
ncbi:P-loop containing nucleoside triphosphate hydrolase protein [Cladorrhinum sp. PSN259]|nr:P-loop containing nucleoside triphosphate hydrolase protein [Cladorrhinum sp. PSN259]